MDDKKIIFDEPRNSPVRSEEELYGSMIRPQGRTSYEDVFEFDNRENKIKKKARNLGLPEMNLTDSTTAILSDGRASFEYVSHTCMLINSLDALQKLTGYDMTLPIRFFYNNYTSTLNLSKAIDGRTLQALFTKQIRQIQETRVHNVDENKEKGDSFSDMFAGFAKKK